MSFESFNFNNEKKQKPEAEQLDINFGVDENGNLIGSYDGEDFIDLENEIKKNREGSEGEFKELTEKELEIIKKEYPVEYFAIMSTLEKNEKETKMNVKKEIKELPTEYSLEEEQEAERIMNEKENPSEQYNIYNRINRWGKKPEAENKEDKNNIKKENHKKHHHSHHKKYHHGGHNINGPIMPFDPLG